MTEDLARSQRPTAQGSVFRRRSRVVPGDLRAVGSRPSSGVAAGMVTGALLGLAVLSAFTLPFTRAGSEPADPAVKLAAIQPAAETLPPAPAPAPVQPAALQRETTSERAPSAASALVLEPLPTLSVDDPGLDQPDAAHRKPRPAARRVSLDKTAR